MVRVVDERPPEVWDEVHHHSIDELRKVAEAYPTRKVGEDQAPRVVEVTIPDEENGEVD